MLIQLKLIKIIILDCFIIYTVFYSSYWGHRDPGVTSSFYSHWKCTNEWPLCSESPLYAITFHQEPDAMKQCSSGIRIYGKFEGRQPAEITIRNSGSLMCRCARRRSGRLDIILRTKPLNWGLVLCWIMSIQEVLRQDVHVTVKMNNENLFWSCFKLMKP